MPKSVLSIDDLKVAYNVLIAREKKAELFLENSKVLQPQKEEWLPEFVKITECLSMLMIKHKEITGVEMKDDEVLNGFK